jgi:hypothetical protein
VRAARTRQAEVENYFINNAYLMPTFHKIYWMGGVSSVAKYPNFSWIDASPGIYAGTYQNWGKMGTLLEPNNAISPPEFCMVANWSQAYGSPRRWGWSDVNCDLVKATFMCRVMPPVVKYCKSETTGSDYVLNTNKMSFNDAMSFCNNCGGLLASYDNMTEQRDVENCFVVSLALAGPSSTACCCGNGCFAALYAARYTPGSQLHPPLPALQEDGWLLPRFHKFYWMGLASNVNGAIWPNFTWLDHGKAIYMGDYQHWGTLMPGRVLEPNNLVPPEVCAGSNLTAGIIRYEELIFDGVGGWADQHCDEKHIFVCEIWPPQRFEPYVSGVSGYEFTLYTTTMNQSFAEIECNANGGHLASYTSAEEQFDVEQYYISNFWLLPAWHKAYWIGLYSESPRTWPVFQWLDGAPAPTNTTYRHWGMLTPQSLQEPNNFGRKPELCAVANASQAFDSPTAWGWADQNCLLKFPFMCKKMQPGAYVYTSSGSMNTYILNTSATNFMDAEASCNSNGGHLVYYDSADEQAEVEQYYIAQGMFIPSYHRCVSALLAQCDWHGLGRTQRKASGTKLGFNVVLQVLLDGVDDVWLA